MPRLRTIAIAAAVIVVTDVTWDGTSLHISFGWPGRKPLASFSVPVGLEPLTTLGADRRVPRSSLASSEAALG